MHTSVPAAPGLRVTATSYPGVPEQLRQIRADLRQALDGCPIADDAILCVSELAANAAQHSDSRRPGRTFTVRTEIRPGAHVRIEVEDDGGPWIEALPGLSRGRGLDIVRAIAAETGINTTPVGRAVWARLDWPSVEQISSAGPVRL
jgi:serine/threonine-protein kinase RsbW